MSRREELRRELPYWYKTGIQDFQNAGDLVELVDSAKLEKSDSYDTMHKKIVKLLLEDVTIDTHSALYDAEGWTKREKQRLLEEWADGWASAAASACRYYFEREEERYREEEEEEENT